MVNKARGGLRIQEERPRVRGVGWFAVDEDLSPSGGTNNGELIEKVMRRIPSSQAVEGRASESKPFQQTSGDWIPKTKRKATRQELID